MAGIVLPKIVYPSIPASPAGPAGLSSTPGGAIAQTTYYARRTYVTLYGEALPDAETSLLVAANNLLVVPSPAAPAAPTVATGWNVYVGNAGAGSETLQNTAPIAIGTNWTEPVTGLVAGAALPSTWGTTLSFQRQPRFVPYKQRKAVRADTFSTFGVRQSLTERVDEYLSFEMEFVGSGSDAANWDSFLQSALQGIPFDYYPDATAAGFTTYALVTTNWDLAYKFAGQYTAKFEFRKEVQQVTAPPGIPTAPTNSAQWVTFTTPTPLGAGGNFTVAHGLGRIPSGVSGPVMTSAGAVWWQASLYDATNLYLVGSDVGLTGMVLAW